MSSLYYVQNISIYCSMINQNKTNYFILFINKTYYFLSSLTIKIIQTFWESWRNAKCLRRRYTRMFCYLSPSYTYIHHNKFSFSVNNCTLSFNIRLLEPIYLFSNLKVIILSRITRRILLIF